MFLWVPLSIIRFFFCLRITKLCLENNFDVSFFSPHCRIQQLKQLLQDTTSDSDSTSTSSASSDHNRKKKKKKKEKRKKEKKKHKKKKKKHAAKASDDSDSDWNSGLGISVLIIRSSAIVCQPYQVYTGGFPSVPQAIFPSA